MKSHCHLAEHSKLWHVVKLDEIRFTEEGLQVFMVDTECRIPSDSKGN